MRFYSLSCLLVFGGIIAKLYRKLQQLAQNIIVVEMGRKNKKFILELSFSMHYIKDMT